MKLKIAAAVILIFLIGCKSKEVRVENISKTDSVNHIEIKKQIEILTLQTDTGLVIEEEITDYQIATDSAGIKTSIPIKKIKKKWHKYNHQLKGSNKQLIKAAETATIKKEIKKISVEKSSFQFKWFLLIIIAALVILCMMLFLIK
jgi:hypothetical protein